MFLADQARRVRRGECHDHQRFDEHDRTEDAPPEPDGFEGADRPELAASLEGGPEQADEDGQIDGDEDERALAPHSPAELADPDRRDSGQPARIGAGGCDRSACRRMLRCRDGLIGRRRGRRLDRREVGHATASGVPCAVTWRKSSSRSLAARAKVMIGSPAVTAAARSRLVS